MDGDSFFQLGNIDVICACTSQNHSKYSLAAVGCGFPDIIFELRFFFSLLPIYGLSPFHVRPLSCPQVYIFSLCKIMPAEYILCVFFINTAVGTYLLSAKTEFIVFLGRSPYGKA